MEALAVTVGIEGTALKQAELFRYLISLVSTAGRRNAEKRARNGLAEANFGGVRNMLTNMSLDIQLSLKKLRC